MNRAVEKVNANRSFFAQVESRFSNRYLAMLIVNGLADDLVNTIRTNNILVEEDCDRYTLVLHIGSIKLQVENNSQIGVIVATRNENCVDKFNSALMITIWQDRVEASLTANFLLAVPFGYTREFSISLPAELDHPLQKILSGLKAVIKGSYPATYEHNLKAWANMQK